MSEFERETLELNRQQLALQQQTIDSRKVEALAVAQPLKKLVMLYTLLSIIMIMSRYLQHCCLSTMMTITTSQPPLIREVYSPPIKPLSANLALIQSTFKFICLTIQKPLLRMAPQLKGYRRYTIPLPKKQS